LAQVHLGVQPGRFTQADKTKCVKGTAQRELRGVKIGINWFLMMNSLAGKCPLRCPKVHHYERSINIISGFSTFLRHPNRLG
jgi:hypothetical protein